MSLDRLKINNRRYYDLPNLAFWGWLSTESQSQNPEFRNNPEKFRPCGCKLDTQTKGAAGYYSRFVYQRHLHICDKYRNNVHWPLTTYMYALLDSIYIACHSVKVQNFENKLIFLKLAVCLQNVNNVMFKWSIDVLKTNQRSYLSLPNSAFWGWFSIESQPQYPEFRNNRENFHPWYWCGEIGPWFIL